MNIKDKQNLLEAYNQINELSMPHTYVDNTFKKIGKGIGDWIARSSAGARGISPEQAMKDRNVGLAWNELFNHLNTIQKNGIDVSKITNAFQQLKANPTASQQPTDNTPPSPSTPSEPSSNNKNQPEPNTEPKSEQQSPSESPIISAGNKKLQAMHDLRNKQMDQDHEYRMAKLKQQNAQQSMRQNRYSSPGPYQSPRHNTDRYRPQSQYQPPPQQDGDYENSIASITPPTQVVEDPQINPSFGQRMKEVGQNAALAGADMAGSAIGSGIANVIDSAASGLGNRAFSQMAGNRGRQSQTRYNPQNRVYGPGGGRYRY